MPDFEMGEPARQGVLNVENFVVVYRFMFQEMADSKGRGAVYLALTYLPHSDAAKIDIGQLLKHKLFTTPQAEPPTSISYNGSPSPPASFTIPQTSTAGIFDTPDSLSSCGSLFSRKIDGSLHIFMDEATPPAPPKYRFTLPKPQPLPALSVEPPPPIPEPTTPVPCKSNNLRRRILLLILASLILIWIAQRFFNAASAKVSDDKTEPSGTALPVEDTSAFIPEATPINNLDENPQIQ